MASGSGQLYRDPNDLSRNDGEYVMPNSVGETTPGWSARTALLLTAAKLYRNPPPDFPPNWGHNKQNCNDYLSEPMEISGAFWIPDITDLWCQQDEMHSKYANLSNVARDIFSIIPHGVRVEACFSLGRDVIGWSHPKPVGETHRKALVVRHFAWANNVMGGVRRRWYW